MKSQFVLGIVLASVGGVVVAADFWQEKEFEDWSEKEVRKLLTNSPWSRQVIVSLPGWSVFGSNAPGVRGPGVGSPDVGRPDAPGGGGNNDRAGAAGTVGGPTSGGGPSGPKMGSTSIRLTVRWVSALPVKQALVRTLAKDNRQDDEQARRLLERQETHYVVAVLGLPERIVGPTGEPDRFKTIARLVRGKKDASFLSPEGIRVQAGRNEVALYFHFPRTETIALEDQNVEFVLNLRDLSVQRKFKLREMVYRGKLEL